jgi:hypothetical protein
MNPVLTTCSQPLPATTILKLSPHQRVVAEASQRAAETVLAAVQFPPRAKDPRPLAELLPDVLAAYGIANTQQSQQAEERFEAVA